MQYHSYVRRRGRGERKRCKCRNVCLSGAAQVARIDELRKVAVLRAVLNAHVLMLVCKVLVRFDEANRS
jgi:hypothetical protein